MSLTNPWVILGILFAIGTSFGWGHHHGWDARDIEMQSEIAKKNEESRAKEQEIQKQLTDQSSKLMEANSVINQKQSSLDRAIRDGRMRLPTPGCVQTPTNATPPAGDSQKAGSQPDRPIYEAPDDRATLAAIAEIIAQGDRNTAQLNACIDSYQKVMEAMNGKR